jgi:hypothetical protein
MVGGNLTVSDNVSTTNFRISGSNSPTEPQLAAGAIFTTLGGRRLNNVNNSYPISFMQAFNTGDTGDNGIISSTGSRSMVPKATIGVNQVGMLVKNDQYLYTGFLGHELSANSSFVGTGAGAATLATGIELIKSQGADKAIIVKELSVLVHNLSGDTGAYLVNPGNNLTGTIADATTGIIFGYHTTGFSISNNFSNTATLPKKFINAPRISGALVYERDAPVVQCLVPFNEPLLMRSQAFGTHQYTGRNLDSIDFRVIVKYKIVDKFKNFPSS